MKINFKPLGDRVLVKTQHSEQKSKGGLILNDSISRGQKVEGEVVAVGTGLFSQTGNPIPMTVNVGDIILYKKDMAGDSLKLGDEEYLIFHEHEILGILNQTTTTSSKQLLTEND